MAYLYKAYTIDKKVVQGRIEVTSESLAEDALYNAGYQRIISLKEVPAGTSIKGSIPTLFGVKTRDVIDFSNQLATLLESGIAILTALQLLRGQASKAMLRDTIKGIIDEIEIGNSFSQALSHHPEVFNNTYVQVIRASEHAGTLEMGLRQASSYLEKQADIFALGHIPNKNNFVSAITKLGSQNLSDPSPSKLVKILFHTHPSISERVVLPVSAAPRAKQMPLLIKS